VIPASASESESKAAKLVKPMIQAPSLAVPFKQRRRDQRKDRDSDAAHGKKDEHIQHQ
jgi:hypothetical protein